MLTTMKCLSFAALIHSAFGGYWFNEQGSVVVTKRSNGKLDLPEIQEDAAKKLDAAFGEFINCKPEGPFLVDTNGVSVFVTVKLNTVQGNSGTIQEFSMTEECKKKVEYNIPRNTNYTKISSLKETLAQLKPAQGDKSPEEALQTGLKYISSDDSPVVKNSNMLADPTPYGLRACLVNGMGNYASGIYLCIGVFFSKK